MAEKNKICHLCGGELEPYGIGKLKCKYCDTIYEEEVINGEEGVLLVNAYKSLRDGETDEAYKAFIDIIDRAPKCYEACLGVALANHGIVYVDDNRSGKRKRVPTCYNTTLTPFREDSYYQTAVKLAPDDIAAKYEKDAEEIDRIRELWLEKAEKEKPYDIFISYKESDDETKQRTADSVQAQELYTWLTDQGYRVFFSRSSLAGKVSEQYEPYIYNALRTAKVMVVYAQKAEYFNSYWMRNEWRRWWKRIDGGDKHPQSLIVAYENMNVYDIPRNLLRGGMQAIDASRKDYFPLLLGHIKRIEESLSAQSGNVRVEVAGFSGKKATRIEGEKIAKKQLGSGVKKIKSTAAAGAVSVREIAARTESELSIDASRALKLANDALANGRYKKALEYYAQVLAGGANAQAYLGTALASVGVKTDAEFIKCAAKYTRFSDFDGIVSACTEEELHRAADLYKNAESECFKANAVEAGVNYFKKLSAYNIPQRQEALDILRGKINADMRKKSASAARLCEVYCEAIAGEDAEEYVSHISSLTDVAMTNAQYAAAKYLNGKIGALDETIDAFIYNNIRMEVSSDLQGSRVLDLFKLKDFSAVDKLLSNVTKNSAEIYNRVLVDAVFAGLKSVFESKNTAVKMRVIELFKIIISYTYKNYRVDGKIANEAGFKFAFFDKLIMNNVSRQMYSDAEIGALKEYILKTLDEDAVDEYAAYEILSGVYFMRINGFGQAKKSFDKALELIPNDANARILKACCDYGVTENDIRAVRADLAPAKKKFDLSVSNAVLYALLKKAGDEVAGNAFSARVEDILKYCKKEEDWQKDAQSRFYVSHVGSDLYYKYLSEFRPSEKRAAVFATIARENLDYKYDPKTQYDFIIKIFTDEILSLINDTSGKKDLELLTDGYYKLLKYIDVNNKTFMCERLKFMGDYMLGERNFELAERFYNYAISENQLDSELYWKRLHAKFHAVNTIELILSKKTIEDDPDFDSVLKLVDEDQAGTYLQVPNKQEYLRQKRSFKSLLNKKKDFIPDSDVGRLFTCSDEEFKKYLKDLDDKEKKEQARKKENRNRAIAKSSVVGAAVVLFLVSLLFVAGAVLAALKFEVVYQFIKIGDSAERQMHLANKAALIVTAAMELVLQIIHVAKLNKTKLGITIVAQIASIGLVLLSDFLLLTGIFSDIFAWGVAIGAVGFMVAYMIWELTADYDEALAALGKSLSTFVIALLYIALSYAIARETITKFIQIMLIIIMVVAMVVGVVWDKLDEWEARSWITTGVHLLAEIALLIVFSIAHAIFGPGGVAVLGAIATVVVAGAGVICIFVIYDVN